MTKILVECPQLIASVRVGVLEPLRPLEKAGLCQIRYRDTRLITRSDVCWCDMLICVRGCEYPTLRVVQAAKAAGRFIVYFLDDDLLNIPKGNASTQYYLDFKIKANLIKILSLCDVLWAVNSEILRLYSKWCFRTVLLRVPADVLRSPPEPTELIHVLYAGSVDHSTLVQKMLAPVIRKILEEYPGQIDFTFIGASPGLEHLKGVAYYPFFESYDAYRKTVLSGEYAIGLAPACDQPFYACKYYNKFIEYSSCGIAGIYSDCEPYRQLSTLGKTVFYVEIPLMTGIRLSGNFWNLRRRRLSWLGMQRRNCCKSSIIILLLSLCSSNCRKLPHSMHPVLSGQKSTCPPCRCCFIRSAFCC